MRILSLDWGEVRIGAAISDPDGKIAFPLDHVIQTKQAFEEIKKLIAEKSVAKIVIGNPKNLKGEESASSEKVAGFVQKLIEITNSPIELLDERFTSVQAQKILQEQGISEKDQRAIKDNIAAQIMLQQYLDTKK
jgi:putative holliday junction resolvase